VWSVVGLLILVSQPVSYSLQFLAGIGLPLLALGALGLARWPAGVTMFAALAFSSTAFFAVRIVLSNQPRWFVPSERIEVALAMRPSCRPGDLLLAPPDIGLYAIGLSACKAYLSHFIVTEFEARNEEARRFYEAGDSAWRARFLEAHCITHVVVPGRSDESSSFLGNDTPFRRVATVTGTVGQVDLYARARPEACGPPP
jgi:hypothetical protein